MLVYSSPLSGLYPEVLPGWGVGVSGSVPGDHRGSPRVFPEPSRGTPNGLVSEKIGIFASRQTWNRGGKGGGAGS